MGWAAVEAACGGSMWRQHARAPEAVAARPVIRPLPPWWRRASQGPHPRHPEQAETGARADLGQRTRGTPTLWPCRAARRWAAEASGGARLVPGGGRKRACLRLGLGLGLGLGLARLGGREDIQLRLVRVRVRVRVRVKTYSSAWRGRAAAGSRRWGGRPVLGVSRSVCRARGDGVGVSGSERGAVAGGRPAAHRSRRPRCG